MTFLPIVERELRVAARKRGTYLLRVFIALLGMFIGLSVVIVNPGAPGPLVGPYIFQGLAGLLLVFCLASGRLSTADCLSEEKREGTLGLLFLTDLKGYDVVLGKLAATSLRAFYGLMAVFPVLALPLLLGGISNGEFWRMVLLLVDTFLLSLTIGILSSALCRDYRRAMACNFALFLVLLGALPATAGVIASLSFPHTVYPELLLCCPVYSFYLCADKRYFVHTDYFWWSIGVTFCLTLVQALLASWIVPHSWRDRPSTTPNGGWRAFWQAVSYGPKATQAAFRRRLLERNPFYWFAARARLKPAQVWAFLAAMLLWWLCGWLTSGRFWLDETVYLCTALLANSALKVWIVLEATQCLAAEQKEGTLELLLSTPLSIKEILQGQLLALRRQFLGPLLAVMAVELVFLWVLHRHDPDRRIPAIWLAGLVMLAVDAVALSWVGMANALKCRNQYRAIASTLVRLLVLPWFLGGALGAVVNFCYSLGLSGAAPTWRLYLALWVGFGLTADLAFGFAAWLQLRDGFRRLALQHLATPKAGWGTRFAGRNKASQRPAENAPHPRVQPGGEKQNTARTQSVTVDRATTRDAKPFVGNQDAWPPAPRRRTVLRLAVVACGLALAAAGFIFLVKRPAYPPPVLVNLVSSNAPLRVFPSSAGGLFILPDGSLWRWGQVGGASARAIVPEPVGTNHDWVEAASAGNRCVGLRRDGTLWEWGRRQNQFSGDPQQLDPGHDWTAIATTYTLYTVALKRDGTAWTWGGNPATPYGTGSTPVRPTRLGTECDWAAITCQWGSALGLRSNGTLWTWGQVTGLGSSWAPLNLPTVTQVCSETNWVGFLPGPWALVRNRVGELWEPLREPPDASASIAATGGLIATNTLPGRFAIAFCNKPRSFELRPDGTLWAQPCSMGPWTVKPGKPRRVGKRSDWVSLWGAGGTAFGLTADGTLWSWGFDGSRAPVRTFRGSLTAIQIQIRRWLGTTTLNVGVGAGPPVQEKPRPLLRLVNPGG